VPFVVVGHRGSPPALNRQASLRAIERLNLALLIDRQNDGVLRRIDIKADDIAQLGNELSVVRQLELPHTMRLQAMRAPDAPHRTDADPNDLGDGRAGPMGCVRRRHSQGQAHDPLGDLGRQGRDARWAPTGRQCLRHQTALPAPNDGLSLPGSPHDLGGAVAISCQQDNSGPPDILLWTIPIADNRLQFGSVGSLQDDASSFRASPRVASPSPRGNPRKNRNVRFYPLAIRHDRVSLR